MKVDYPFIAYCYQRYFNCLMDNVGADAYIRHGRNHAYVAGMPLNAESNGFIISGKFLISLWFDPVEKEVYAELRYSPNYVVHASGIASMRNMKMAGVLADYPLLCVLHKGPLTAIRIEDWLASARYKYHQHAQERSS